MKISSELRRCLLRALAGVGLTVSLAGCAFIAEPVGGAQGEDKALVCHKGKKTLSVATPAREAHLRHGDTPGPCR